MEHSLFFQRYWYYFKGNYFLMYQANIFFDYLKIVLKIQKRMVTLPNPQLTRNYHKFFFCDKNLSYLFVRISDSLCVFFPSFFILFISNFSFFWMSQKNLNFEIFWNFSSYPNHLFCLKNISYLCNHDKMYPATSHLCGKIKFHKRVKLIFNHVLFSN